MNDMWVNQMTPVGVWWSIHIYRGRVGRRIYRLVAMFLLGDLTGLDCAFTTTRLSSVCSKKSLNFSRADLSFCEIWLGVCVLSMTQS